MKKTLLLLSALMLTFHLFSQSYYRSYDHHDISLSYGMFLPSQFQEVNNSMLNEMYPAELYVSDYFKGSGALFITYRHMFRNENMFFGLTAGMSNFSWDIYNIGSDEGVLKTQNYTFAFDWEYRYRNQGPIQLYSGLGIGITLANQKFTPTDTNIAATTDQLFKFGYQLNAIGVRVGKKLGGYAEFGYGYKGIINLGISLQLF